MVKNLNTLLVIDVGNPACDNMLHDRDFLNNISHTLLPIYELVRKAQTLGIESITPNDFLKDSRLYKNKKVLLISHLVTKRTDQLLKAGAMPFLLLCQESPIIATRFYLLFHQITKSFQYTLAFSGMKRQAHKRTVFYPMHFPIYIDPTITQELPVDFSNKKHLVLIAGNKQVPWWKILPLKLLYGTSVKAIYSKRKTLVSELALSNSIDIFGHGWETNSSNAVRGTYKGSLGPDKKYSTLSQYKFTLCFENAIFPGYITEKIFDAFLAKSVPIYLGNPEVLNCVPRDSFIDARDYKNTSALQKRLEEMTANEHQEYLDQAKNFLSSQEFLLFHYETFTNKIIHLIQQNDR